MVQSPETGSLTFADARSVAYALTASGQPLFRLSAGV